MDQKLLLAKCIGLIYKESKLKNEGGDSRDYVKNAVSRIVTRDPGMGLTSENNTIAALKMTVMDMIATPPDQEIDRSGLLQRIRIDVGDNDKLYSAIEKGLDDDNEPDVIRRSIKNNRRSIDRYLDDTRVTELLSAANSRWNYSRDKIENTYEFLETLRSQLEPLAALKTREDPAIINEVRIGDNSSLSKVLSDIHITETSSQFYRTGWQGLNRMLQGGIRRGEMWVQGGLQHNYKTGLSKSIFSHIPLYNQPYTGGNGRVPAVIHYSFEDTIEEGMKFTLTQLLYTERREMIDIRNMTTTEMQDAVQTRLKVNGFEVFFFRVNPTKWTYMDLFRHIQHLETSGYSIEFVMADYLDQLPKTGCDTSGPSGNDILDLFKRTRLFFSEKKIAFWTPHQLSPDCKKLIRGQISEDKLVKEIVGRGYFKGTTQLDQIPDGIIFNHKFVHNGETYLAIQRDRHRLLSIVDEKYKYMLLKFPKGMPIPDDLNGDDSTLYKLPSYAGNADESLFSFGE